MGIMMTNTTIDLRNLLLLILQLTLIAGSGSARALITSHAPAIFIFGDSLADVGNNNFIPFTTLKSDFYPNGIDFPGRVATGRFCNGHLVLDILASRLGFPVPLPYLSPSTKGLALLQGVNYASAGCGILNETSNNSSGCLSLSTQLKCHTNTVERIVGQLGSNETQAFLSKSLYFVLIGSNDFLGNYIKRSNSVPLDHFIDILVSSLANSVAGSVLWVVPPPNVPGLAQELATTRSTIGPLDLTRLCKPL